MGSITINTNTSTLISDFQTTTNDLPDLAEESINNVSDIFLDYVLRYTPIGETGVLFSFTMVDVDGFLNRTL